MNAELEWRPKVGDKVRVPRIMGTLTTLVSHGEVKALHNDVAEVEVAYGRIRRYVKRFMFKIKNLQKAGTKEKRIHL